MGANFLHQSGSVGTQDTLWCNTGTNEVKIENFARFDGGRNDLPNHDLPPSGCVHFWKTNNNGLLQPDQRLLTVGDFEFNDRSLHPLASWQEEGTNERKLEFSFPI